MKFLKDEQKIIFNFRATIESLKKILEVSYPKYSEILQQTINTVTIKKITESDYFPDLKKDI